LGSNFQVPFSPEEGVTFFPKKKNDKNIFCHWEKKIKLSQGLSFQRFDKKMHGENIVQIKHCLYHWKALKTEILKIILHL
jgi:hypothetical protein